MREKVSITLILVILCTLTPSG